MKYSLCEFEDGYEGQFYQESDENGFVRFIDLDCNVLDLISPYGYYVVEDNVPTPSCIIG